MTDACGAYEKLYRAATTGIGDERAHVPAPCQVRFALDPVLPAVLEVPGNVDRTETVLLAWLWRRRFAEPDVRARTPRRLVLCVAGPADAGPMRDRVREMLRRLDLLARGPGSEGRIAVSVMTGGEVGNAFPGRETVVVGCPDALLQRGEWLADALWVLDDGCPGAAQRGNNDGDIARVVSVVAKPEKNGS